MKRAPALYPLSHDHHHTLVLCLRIKKGVTKGIAVDRMAIYLTQYGQQELAHHFLMEETVLLPVLDQQLDHFKRLQQEHEQIRMQLQWIKEEPSSERLLALAQLLEDHVRYEERMLFPWIEKNVSESQLMEIGKALAQEVRPSCTTEDAFWDD